MKTSSTQRFSGCPKHLKFPLLLAASALLFPAFLPLAGAQSTWTGATDGAWGEAGNWDPSGVPGTSSPGVALTFGTADTYGVNLGGVERFASGASALTFTSENDYTFTNGALTLADGAGMAMNGSGNVTFDVPVNLGSGTKSIGGTGSGVLRFNESVTRTSGGANNIATRVIFAEDSVNDIGTTTLGIQSGGVLELAKTTQAAQVASLGAATLSFTGGTLRISNTSAVFNNSITVGTNNGTIEASQNVSFQNLSINNSRILTLTGSATVTFNGTVTCTRVDELVVKRQLTLAGTGNAVFNGLWEDLLNNELGITMSGSGTVQLNSTASTNTGITTLNSGVIVVTKLANGGSVSSIGQATSAAANLDFNGGTLRYVGAGDSTDRAFTLRNSGGTIDSSGTGALTMTATAMAHIGGGARTLTLTGTNTGNNSLATVITNNGAQATNLAKTGDGLWSLTNTSTYTGSTTISAGTLVLAGSGSINSTSGVTLNGANAAFRSSSSTNFTAPLTWTQGRLEGTNWNGSLAGLIIGSNQIISPGNSPGTANTTSQTWAGGGAYLWEINDANGSLTPGSDPGWDLLVGSDTLTITATDLSQFTIYVTSLTTGNAPGNAANFNNTVDQSWLIADFANDIIGFDPDAFVINTANFTNPTLSGSYFSVALGSAVGGDDSQLYLTYTIPEPATWMTLLLGAGILAWRRRSAA